MLKAISIMSNHFSFSAGFQVQKGRLIDFIPRVEQQYYLSFEVKPGPRIIPHWGSIVHLTIHGNLGKLGERIPAVWFHPRTRALHICTALGTNVNYCYNSGNLPTNRYITGHFIQKQLLFRRKYL